MNIDASVFSGQEYIGVGGCFVMMKARVLASFAKRIRGSFSVDNSELPAIPKGWLLIIGRFCM
ncbi:hypothetical protein TorRG33x02_342740 [Trema orientale]|uniref:Uncharacterized protein n=1 Tax=Trema orientale TaxID=63057 RepID=A0A2P5AS84_TREOI|nr:hypothetical protein TorRG33x02_342740 [Trema orientale]